MADLTPKNAGNVRRIDCRDSAGEAASNLVGYPVKPIACMEVGAPPEPEVLGIVGPSHPWIEIGTYVDGEGHVHIFVSEHPSFTAPGHIVVDEILPEFPPT